MFRKMIEKKEGFTLIELLIVVAIIAILAAIAIPQFSKYKERGYKASLTSDIKNAYTAAMAYLTDYPSGTVGADDLTNYGYQTSSGINIANASIDGAGGGNIEIWHSTLNSGDKPNIAVIDADGLINYN